MGKSPGPDMIPPEVIRFIAENGTESIIKVFKNVLKRGEFPKRWKVADLILIPKPGKEIEDPGVFRPISLIDCVEKLLKHVITARLNEALQRKGGMSPKQHGFRPGRSTQLKRYATSLQMGNQKFGRHVKSVPWSRWI